ncbi:hypothetical protein CBM2637_A170025 [Cupriavidus taiwanensis]|nr:hypothetical protein CBM2637_A170025 [Cupriavidus taiwanensis]
MQIAPIDWHSRRNAGRIRTVAAAIAHQICHIMTTAPTLRLRHCAPPATRLTLRRKAGWHLPAPGPGNG